MGQLVEAPSLERLSPETVLQEMSTLGVEELKEVVRGGLRMVAESYLRIAMSLRLLEEKGDDLEWARQELDPHTYNWLRRIGNNTLLADVVVKFKGKREVVNTVAKLPLPDQQRIVREKRVSMVVLNNGRPDRISADVAEMQPAQIKQVFDGGRIRSESEQRLWLEGKRQEKADPIPETVGPFSIDKETGVIYSNARKGEPISGDTIIRLANVVRRLREAK